MKTRLFLFRFLLLPLRLCVSARDSFRTANESDMKLSGVVCTENIAAIPDGGWALIAPYGDHPSPDKKYVQHFDRAQALKVIDTWESIPGIAFRCLKNVAHGMGARSSTPIWDGHADRERTRAPKAGCMGEITDLTANEQGLMGKISWNAQGETRRKRGPLYPSPLWWHEKPSGEPPTVYPELLESVGLVPTPNINNVPAWTANARLGAEQESVNDANPMNEKQLQELRAALGLPESADAATCITTAQTANAARAQVTTANSAKTEVETKLSKAEGDLTSANGKVTTLTTELDGLKTANGKLTTEKTGLTTEVEALRKGALDLAEKKGVFTAAEREGFSTKLTANAAVTLTELQTRKPALNTKSIELNGNRVDLSTANARSEALQDLVKKHMEEKKCDYNTAFAAVRRNPAHAGLFDAMKPVAAAAS